jgi:hypothetical protein
MWRRLRPIIFGLSLAINLALIGAWSFHRLRGTCQRKALPAAPPAALTQRIGVTGTRAAQIEGVLDRFRDGMRERCRHIEALRRELLELVAAETVQADAVTAAREAMLAAQAEAQQQVLAHLVDLKQILEPEEQQRLFDLLRSHGGCAGPGRLLGKPGPDRPQPPEEGSR